MTFSQHQYNRSLMKRILTLLLLTTIHTLLPKTTPLKVGKSFTVALQSNPTTGYSWRCTCDPQDHVAVTSAFIRDAENPHAVGVGGTETFTLTAQKPGNVTCTFQYGRAWEPESFGNTQKHILKIKK